MNLERNESKEKGDSFLQSKQFMAVRDKNQLEFDKTIGSFSLSINKTINALSGQIKILNEKIIGLTSTRKKEKDTTLRKEDPNKKLYKAVDDLEPLMKESIKIQKQNQEGKGKGLLGLITGLGSLASLVLAGGGLLGFLMTGKQEFLFSVIKGFKKAFFDFPDMLFKGLKASKNLFGITDTLKDIMKFGKTISRVFSRFGVSAAGKAAIKLVGRAAGTGAKVALKKIPGIGTILGLFFGIQRFQQGDIIGGIGEIASGIASMFPGPGTLISLAIDGLLLMKDFKTSKKTKEEKPKKGSPADLRKMPIIGGLVTMFDGLKLVFGGVPITGVKTGLIGMAKLLPIPGMSFLLQNIAFPIVDGIDWLVKETPKFLGMVGSKIVAMAPAAYDMLKKVPVIGWYISGIEGIINFAKDPKAGVENIAGFMNNMIPGSGDLILKAGSIIFGAADWIMQKGKAILGWTGNILGKMGEGIKEAFSKEGSSLNTLEQQTKTSAIKVDKKATPKDKKLPLKERLKDIILSKAKNITEASREFKAGSELAISTATNVGGKFVREGIKALTGVDISGIQPKVWDNFTGMADEYKQLTGKDILITSGFRSIEKQAELYKKKGPKYAAAPGRSMHNFGYALDIDNKMTGAGDDLEKRGLLKKYGFDRPMSYEPWHIEPIGLKAQYADVRAGKMVDNSTQEAGDAYAIKNLPSSVIPSKYNVNNNSSLNLSDSTIKALAQAIGVSFKGALPTPRANQVNIDVGMRG